MGDVKVANGGKKKFISEHPVFKLAKIIQTKKEHGSQNNYFNHNFLLI